MLMAASVGSASDARSVSRKYSTKHNQHALGDKTPDGFYFENLPALPKAAQATNSKASLNNSVQLSKDIS